LSDPVFFTDGSLALAATYCLKVETHRERIQSIRLWLVEIPYMAMISQADNALLAGRISDITVAATPGHWIGAGGSP
jgi:hypothetical protein